MEFPTSVLQSAPAREAIRIVDRLRDNGFLAVLAGGCVRDALLGRTPKDFDVATEATPDSVQRVFGKRHTIAFGASFGVIGVIPPRSKDGSRESLPPTEVATFRADGTYSDGRRPDHVTYGTAEADAARRDFTINGLFYDPAEDAILDYVDGIADLQSMHLRTIGEADRRFDEDKLRMLRAVRFVTTLGLSVESATLAAIHQHADSLRVVSGERIGAEMRRVMCQGDAGRGLQLLVDTGLSRHVWPGLDAMNWAKLRSCWQRLPEITFETAMATTLSVLSSEAAEAQASLKSLARRWKLSTVEQRAIIAAIEWAPRVVQCVDEPWSNLQPILVNRDVDVIVAVAQAIAEDGAGISRAQRELQREPATLNPPPLLSGDDLIEMGLTPGQNFRTWLAEIRRLQLDDRLCTREDAVAWVRQQT
ncbi:CCA tRNA nucleotidyltransferase [Allorhodopirellula solitaria]|uniref:tRNA nucleotidyltransferase/poly(A) polymerase n=1 Tax=Allorhodopirellula solitaria TaxID=2527987 RepID=A0A5C5YH39_9BACT|nr:CCA tRNA nucleotidyltransferase [Allorhodopirellula solitaria]TWT74333.1 tRNA nucleotidyltransferase/poly(A) polymerase [Allorhodopirellula solitaria]